jgi:hypothetical protein
MKVAIVLMLLFSPAAFATSFYFAFDGEEIAECTPAPVSDPHSFKKTVEEMQGQQCKYVVNKADRVVFTCRYITHYFLPTMESCELTYEGVKRLMK